MNMMEMLDPIFRRAHQQNRDTKSELVFLFFSLSFRLVKELIEFSLCSLERS